MIQRGGVTCRSWLVGINPDEPGNLVVSGAALAAGEEYMDNAKLLELAREAARRFVAWWSAGCPDNEESLAVNEAMDRLETFLVSHNELPPPYTDYQ